MPDFQVSDSRFEDLRNNSLNDGIKSLIKDGKLNKINLNFDSYYANQEIMDTQLERSISETIPDNFLTPIVCIPESFIQMNLQESMNNSREAILS